MCEHVYLMYIKILTMILSILDNKCFENAEEYFAATLLSW